MLALFLLFPPQNSTYVLTPPYMARGFRAAMFLKNEEFNIHLFSQPFDWRVWLSLGATFLLISGALTAISAIYKKWLPGGETEFSFSQSLWYLWSTCLGIGSSVEPRSAGGRLLTGMWCGFFIVTLAMYTANLAAIFGTDLAQKPMTSVEEMVDAKVKAYSLTLFEPVLDRWNEASFIGRLKAENRFHLVDDVRSQFLRKELERGSVLIMPELLFEIMLRLEYWQGLYLLDGRFNFLPYSVAIRQGWPWMGAVNRLFDELGQTGIFEAIIRKHKSEHPKPVPRSATMVVAKFLGLYIMVALVIVSAFLVTIVQVMREKTRRKTLLLKVSSKY